jgi:hypothetical protein
MELGGVRSNGVRMNDKDGTVAAASANAWK